MKKFLIALAVVLVLLGGGVGTIYYLHSSNLTELKKLETVENGWSQILAKIDQCNYPLCGWLLTNYRNQVAQEIKKLEEEQKKIEAKLTELKAWEETDGGWQKISDEVKKCASPCAQAILDYGKTADEQIALVKDYQTLAQDFATERTNSNKVKDEIYSKYGDYDYSYEGGKNCDLVPKQETYVNKMDEQNKAFETFVAGHFDKIEQVKNKMLGRNQAELAKILTAWREYQDQTKKYHELYDVSEKQFLDFLKKECAGTNIETEITKWEKDNSAQLDAVEKTFTTARETAEKLGEELTTMNTIK